MNRKSFGLVMGLVFVLSAACTKKSPPASTTAPDALQQLKDAAAKLPSYDNFINLGLGLAKAGNTEEALAAYRKAIEINPKAPLAYNNICAELNGKSRFAEALPNCEKAVELDPNFVLAKNNLNWAKAKAEEASKGLLKKKEELMKDAKKTSAQVVDLGMQFYSLRSYDPAVELWKSIKKTDPLYATSQNNLASAYIVMNKFDLAEKALAEALGREPNNQLFKNNKNWLEQKKKSAN